MSIDSEVIIYDSEEVEWDIIVNGKLKGTVKGTINGCTIPAEMNMEAGDVRIEPRYRKLREGW
jgi:hypothetical protein